MGKRHNRKGFSLTEVLMAVGTLAVGMILIGGVFPVAIHFTTIASERTIAAVVADEAFAKIQLYGIIIDPNQVPTDSCVDFNDISSVNPVEFAYPSTGNVMMHKYFWSALCRRVDIDSVQVTVFITKKTGAGGRYWDRLDGNLIDTAAEPVPVSLKVSTARGDELLIIAARADRAEWTFINDGYTIVDNRTGQLYRVLERDTDQRDKVTLDRYWQGNPPALVWVVPPPASGGRYPCIAVYQKVMKLY